jgi:nucleotide sugar dehydrogenase
MKVGVIGIGMVGGALFRFFQAQGVEIVGYDKFKPDFMDHMKLRGCDVIFVCVPTPTVEHEQDMTAIHDAMALIKRMDLQGEVVLKSTVLPGTCRRLWRNYGIEVIHNPEFLTERNADADFANQKQIVIGSDVIAAHKVGDLYARYLPLADIHDVSTVTSELYKYAHNCFLATKVVFWNEMYQAAGRCKANFEQVRDMLVETGKAGSTHNQVPGPDGKLGYGGACFPKDMAAFARWYGEGLIGAADEVNDLIRHSRA